MMMIKIWRPAVDEPILLQWRHSGRDDISNHQPRHCLYSNVYSGADQRKHQSSVSLAFVRGIHRWPVNCPHKWPVTRKIFPFDDVIMYATVYELISLKFCRISFWFNFYFNGPAISPMCTCHNSWTNILLIHKTFVNRVILGQVIISPRSWGRDFPLGTIRWNSSEMLIYIINTVRWTLDIS